MQAGSCSAKEAFRFSSREPAGRPDSADAAGLRPLEQAQKGRVKERIIACRTGAAHKLADGTWVVDVAELLKRVGS